MNSSETFEGNSISEISRVLNIKKDQIPNKVKKLMDEWNDIKSKLDQTSQERIKKFVNNAESYHNRKIIFGSFKDLGNKDIQNISSNIIKMDDDYNTIFFNENNSGTTVTGMLGPNEAKYGELHMGDLITGTVKELGGSGGGRREYGSGFVAKTIASRDKIEEYIRKKLFEEE